MNQNMPQTPLTKWFAANHPSDDMRWKDAALDQQTQMLRLLEGLEPSLADVPSTHRSKSIVLPVLHLRLKGVDVYLRDNFHDINICFICDTAPELDPLQVYGEGKDWDWYLGEISRARGYSWREWTDEEMNNPQILRVADKRPDVTNLWWEKSGEEKDRWARRLTDPAWYVRDWSHAEIIVDGNMGPGCTLYLTEYPFMQGISEVVPDDARQCWKSGRKNFTVVMRDWGFVLPLIEMVAKGSDCDSPCVKGETGES